MTLKEARINAGLTQRSAAKMLNVSYKTLGNWEKGITIPKIERIDDICGIYNISYDELIFLTPITLKA